MTPPLSPDQNENKIKRRLPASGLSYITPQIVFLPYQFPVFPSIKGMVDGQFVRQLDCDRTALLLTNKRTSVSSEKLIIPDSYLLPLSIDIHQFLF